MLDRNYYVLCDDNCRFPSMTKEQILTAIQQAVSSGTIKDVDAGFITKIVEQNGNKPLQLWVGTQAQYNALTTKDDDTIYFTDDTTTVEALQAAVEGLKTGLSGAVKIGAVLTSAATTTSSATPLTATAGQVFLPKYGKTVRLEDGGQIVVGVDVQKATVGAASTLYIYKYYLEYASGQWRLYAAEYDTGGSENINVQESFEYCWLSKYENTGA